MRPITRFATIAAAAVTAFGGVACEMEGDGNGSPGQEEAPAGDTGEDGGY
ncbi:MAG: hypothetical protein KY457_11710 [Actinobacteria bacterium]|nr:hypothetical protein [Actinomycetota bacterium]